MGNIKYTPTFQHTDWVDDVDRVAADGTTGFNGRFRAINNDLLQLSTVVGQIGASIDDLVANPPGPPLVLTLAPLFARPESSPAWFINATGAAQAVGSFSGAIPPPAQPQGVLDPILPDRCRLISLRAIGQATGTTVTITLSRATGTLGTPDVLASVTGDATTYDKTAAVDPARTLVDLSTFRYFITATTAAPAGPLVTIGSLQIAYFLR
ncbi:hypothetical protein [Dactylosporangium sp. CA-092794]|uniref:hypothetical protein n=1 Tax=Dactylosporangium sp. CA-092794 TaxID=3239929 RepID=UPI003D8DDAB2